MASAPDAPQRCYFVAAMALILQTLDTWQQLRGSFLELCLHAASAGPGAASPGASSSTQVLLKSYYPKANMSMRTQTCVFQ